MEKKQSKKLKKVLLIICIFISGLFLSFGGYIVFLYNNYKLDVNKLTSVNNGVKVYSASMKDSTLYNSNRSIIEIENLPSYVKNAFIDTEDKRFYSHNGYDLKRIIKASLVNIASHSKSQGASTISQQLVKNALLSNEKTYSRKIQEIILSIKLEKKFSKDEILEMYLNTIYFGSNAYGIENASKTYFNKSAKDLTLNEVCCLAGIIKSPSYYSPIKNYNNAIKRRDLVANSLYKSKHINKQEYEEVLKSPIKLAKNEFDYSYEREAILESCNLLNISERELINKKYQIVTFKDDELQANVIAANNSVIEECSPDDNLDALSIVTNNNGQIVAYYANSNYNLHNINRQPASTFKPLAVYLPCLVHNILTPSTLILDEQIDINGYSPKNADGNYNGYVSTREAISKSLNIPAVKALEYVGLSKSNEVLTNLGFNLDKSDLNLSLALGSTKNGVKLMNLLSAYSVIANLGIDKGLSFVNRILDEKGNTIYSHEDFTQRLVNEEDCFLLTDMLKDTTINGTARRLNELNLPLASKTGTAFNGKNNTDLYNICYSTEHAMLTWIGDLKNNILPKNLSSSNEPTQINKQILQYLYKNNKPKDFKCPENVAKLPFDYNEYIDNHIIVEPSSKLERFKKYDYFKLSNPPQENFNKNLNFQVSLDKLGANLSFNASKSHQYSILKETNKGVEEIASYKEKMGEISFLDKNVFVYDEINYILKNELEQKEIKIRPKDYLVNLLNNEIVSGKKKWYV